MGRQEKTYKGKNTTLTDVKIRPQNQRCAGLNWAELVCLETWPQTFLPHFAECGVMRRRVSGAHSVLNS